MRDFGKIFGMGRGSGGSGDTFGGMLTSGPAIIVLVAVGLFLVAALLIYVWKRSTQGTEMKNSISTSGRGKSRRRRRSRRSSSRSASEGSQSSGIREQHRPRPISHQPPSKTFPSLAEAGGLPPVRAKAEVDPPAGS